MGRMLAKRRSTRVARNTYIHLDALVALSLALLNDRALEKLEAQFGLPKLSIAAYKRRLLAQVGGRCEDAKKRLQAMGRMDLEERRRLRRLFRRLAQCVWPESEQKWTNLRKVLNVLHGLAPPKCWSIEDKNALAEVLRSAGVGIACLASVLSQEQPEVEGVDQVERLVVQSTVKSTENWWVTLVLAVLGARELLCE